jgi:Putative zinc ribbon domain
MPLRRDEAGGGTNRDGSRSTEYCSHCYQDGRFTEPNISVEEMMAKVEGKLRTMHIPGFVARRITQGIPKLDRWMQAPAGQAGY